MTDKIGVYYPPNADPSELRGRTDLWQTLEREPMPIDTTENPPATTAKPDDIVSQYIYLDTLDSYFRISDKQLLKPSALNRKHKLEYPGDSDNPNATSTFDNSPDKRVASGKGWLPIADSIIELDGVLYANTYAGIQLRAERGDGNISEWLALCSHIYGEHDELVIDHFAFSIQRPLEKIRWQILVQGKPRNGKSMSIRPLIKIWASAGVSLSPDEVLAGWADGLVGRKFVCMEEVYMPDNKGFFNNLKTKLANDYVERLNVKKHGQVVQQNLYSMVLFTNHLDALHFDEDDDKLLVIESNNERWQKERYKALAEAIDNSDLANKIYYFLLHRDISNFEYGSLPFRTDAAVRMAQASLPDYQKAISEMIEGREPPFDKKLFTLQRLREELRERNYKHGDKGLVDILTKSGFARFRGQKRILKVTTPTPTFWTKANLEEKTAAELYEFYEMNKL
ncbi:hypothetical protein N8198_00230 [Gammaproteobacteria bacterium]|nr:hypothetical protein [Gammaproteobacteria bacterium]